MPYFVYILETLTGTLYCGIASDVPKRLAKHMSGNGAKYTRAFGVKKLVYTEELKTRSEALKREREIKNFSREKKLDLVGKISNAQT